MARRKWVQVDGELIEVDPKTYQARNHRDAGGGVIIHEDTMPDTWNPVDGQMYDSRSRMVKNNRAVGCYEVGNDVMTPAQVEKKRAQERQEVSRRNAHKFDRAFQTAYQQLTGKSWV